MTESTEAAQSELPSLTVPLAAEAIVAKIDESSRRGRMPGFEAGTPQGLFVVDAWGTPFDHDLIATAHPAGGETRLDFTLRLRRKIPAVHAILLLFTVWPGVWLTDSMLKLWFGWYYALTQKDAFIWGGFEAFTYLWYVPLCVVPLPWFWRSSMRRSRRTARVSGLEMIAKIAKELGIAAPPEAAAALEAVESPPA